MNSTLSTSYWLWKAKNKDPEAYAKVYDLYVDKIYRFVYFKISDKETAQDISSEAFLKTWEYINTGKEIKNLNALIYSTARNLVIDHYRKKSTQNLQIDEMMEETEESMRVDHESEIVNTIDVQILEKTMGHLKDEYREILLLRYVEDFDLPNIAQIMNKKPGATRVLLHRATKSLKDLIEKIENNE